MPLPHAISSLPRTHAAMVWITTILLTGSNLAQEKASQAQPKSDPRAAEIKQLAGLPPIMPMHQPINLLDEAHRGNLYTWLKDCGYDDPRHVFRFEDGILKISGDGLGGIITKRNFANYHLICEFRFTGPTLQNRKENARDSGILVHGIGPDGSYGNIWLSSIESPQIIEGGMGDVIVVAGKLPDGTPLPVGVSAEVTKDIDGEYVWSKGGEKRRFTSGRVNWFGRDPDWADKVGFRGKNDIDGKLGEWTRLECICNHDRITNICNGVIVNELFDVTPTAGKITLQSELAAFEVRRWELWPIGSAPTSLKENAPANPHPKKLAEPTGFRADGILKAGGYAIDVSPPRFPISCNGGFVQQMASKLHDPLHARCLVLNDGAQKMAIVAVDACILDRQVVDRAKLSASAQTGIPVANMLICSTHTHSAPTSMSIHGSEKDDEYVAFLEAKIVAGIVKAASQLVPAKLGWGAAPFEKFIFCRRWYMKQGTCWNERFTGRSSNEIQMNPGHLNPNALMPASPVDADLSVLYLTTLADEPLAVVANYSTHYAGAPAVSADYFGEFARQIQQLLMDKKPAPQFVAMMTNGTSGDANTRNFAGPPITAADHHLEVGKETAQHALSIINRINPKPGASLDAVTQELTLKVRLPNETELAEATKFVNDTMNDRLPRSVVENYARETVLLSKMPATRTLLLQSLRIGPYAITAMPNEVYGLTGLTIKRDGPFASMMNVSLANGYFGYIPPTEHHRLGGYTTWRARSACLEVGAESAIRTTQMKLLERLASNVSTGQHAQN